MRFTANTLTLLERGDVRNLAAWQLTWQPAVLWLAGANNRNTRATYAGPVAALMRGSSLPLDAVTAEQVLAYKVHLVDRGLAPRTIRHHLIVLSSFFRWAIAGGHHGGPNPVDGVPLPRCGGALAGIALSSAAVRRLLAAAANTRDRALLATLAGAGLRAAEACALQERDLHFPEIDQVAFHVRSGKGGKGREIVVRDMDLAVCLSAYLVDRPCTGPSTYLFQARDGRAVLGRPISRDLVYRIVKATAARASLGHLTPHDLRRTYATLSLDMSEPLPQVQRRMGHARMEQTARYYRE